MKIKWEDASYMQIIGKLKIWGWGGENLLNVQKVTSLLADGLCPKADKSLIQGLGATMKTNTHTHIHPPSTKSTFTESENIWIYMQLFHVIDLIDLIDMKNNNILKPFTQMSKDT